MSEEREQRQAKTKLTAQAERDDYMAMLAIPAGRRVLARILRRCGVESAVFSSDAMAMSLLEGRRSIGIELWAELREQAPEHWRQVRDALDEL